MARIECGARLGLVAAATFFLLLQARLFAVQSKYADRIAQAVDGETKCSRSKRALIDQFSAQQGRIVALEDEKEKLESKYAQLNALVGEYRRHGKDSSTKLNEGQKTVAAVVIMACNRPDYLDRTLNSVLKYQRPIAQKFPLFVFQVLSLIIPPCTQSRACNRNDTAQSKQHNNSREGQNPEIEPCIAGGSDGRSLAWAWCLCGAGWGQ